MASEDASTDRRRLGLPAPVLRELAFALARLGGIGLAAIGVSGGVAAAMGALFGRSFVAGDPPGVTYAAARCAEFLEYVAGTRTCEEAATVHHFGETVSYRLAAGLLGLAVLLAAWWLRRARRAPRPSHSALPEGFEATVGLAVSATGALGLLGFGLDQLAVGRSAGTGAYLSGGVVALALAAGFGLSLHRTLLRRATAVS